MAFNSIDSQANALRIAWFGIIMLVALLLGYFLASSMFMMAAMTMGVVWLICLPYHSQIAVAMAMATFNSALIVPFFPGRPYLWEFAALLGWTGLFVALAMRRTAKGVGEEIHTHRWLFIGIVGYCAILVVTMFYRGFGLRILGNLQMGGRYYFQQLTCAIFPLLFLVCRPSEKTISRLFLLQCILSVTFLVSDFVFSIAPKELFVLLQFFELPGDAANFEYQAGRFGIRRFQSLYIVSHGLFFLLLLRYRVRDFFTGKGLYLVPLGIAILSVGLLSGHRYLAMIISISMVFIMYAQRAYDIKLWILSGALGLPMLILTYFYAADMPLAAQRAISFLPGIEISQQAIDDGFGTMETRRILRQAGLEMAKDYIWVGRGFGLTSIDDFSVYWDPTTVTKHINQGRFFNGFIGLLVNTGGGGTLFMLLFLTVGTRLAWTNIRNVRQLGSDSVFLRVSSVVSGLWMANTVAFLFFHGDSEYALKTFSLQAGVLLVCHHHLQARLKGGNVAVETVQPVFNLRDRNDLMARST